MVAIIQKRGLRDFDWLLAILAIGIVCFGTIQIRYAQPTENFWVKQLIGLGIAIIAMLAIAFSDYRKLLNIAPAFYVFGLLLLVIVLVPSIGLKINGQRAWIRVPGIGQFQPSEFVKVTTAMMLARYFGKHRTSVLTLKELAMGGVILGMPIVLILLEHDVGQVLTYLPILVVVLFLSAIKMRFVVAAIVLGLVLLPFAYWVGVKTHLIKNYQQERINVILDPEKADRRGFGYNTWQSILTVGEGGLLGADNSGHSQSSLKFLPEPHTDFIFAVTAGSAGFVGCIIVLFAYVLLLSRLISGAKRAPDRMGMLVIMATVGGLTCQIFINVGMALGILPVIGVPLPLMSAGLASLIATFIAIGFAMSVQLRRFVN
ncbi:MAG: FtsW/RodA/SpoVE family cell cycle protein [bacterium]